MTTTAQPRSAGEILAWGRHVLDPALRAAVDTLPVSSRHVAGYHLGWWEADGSALAGSPGKAIRPTLTLLFARGAGASEQEALPAAVAVELVHNFSLLHDDAMDGDVTRRHRRTAWAQFGLGEAILAGDALLTLALRMLGAAGRAPQGLELLAATVMVLIDGQSSDLAFERRADVDLDACVAMALAKTGSLLGCACALGALSAGAAGAQVEHARGFGERLGLAFQLVDDLLGIWGDPAVTGKAAHSDLASRKKSLPVVAALRSGTPAADEFGALYHGGEPLDAARLERAAALVEACGGRRWAEAQAERERAAALAHLDAAGLDAQAVAELETLAWLVTARDR